MNWRFWERKKKEVDSTGLRYISADTMIKHLSERGYVTVNTYQDCDSEAPEIGIIRDYLRSGGWVVMFLPPHARKCMQGLCWMEVYSSKPSVKEQSTTNKEK